MKGEREDRPWLDELREKHECGPSYVPYRTMEVAHEGATLLVSLPDQLDHPERLEVSVASENHSLLGRHLTLIGSYETERGYFSDEPNVVLMAAHRRDDGPYVVHVWHDLYPWALDHLGLRPDGKAPSSR